VVGYTYSLGDVSPVGRQLEDSGLTAVVAQCTVAFVPTTNGRMGAARWDDIRRAVASVESPFADVALTEADVKGGFSVILTEKPTKGHSAASIIAANWERNLVPAIAKAIGAEPAGERVRSAQL